MSVPPGVDVYKRQEQKDNMCCFGYHGLFLHFYIVYTYGPAVNGDSYINHVAVGALREEKDDNVFVLTVQVFLLGMFTVKHFVQRTFGRH